MYHSSLLSLFSKGDLVTYRKCIFILLYLVTICAGRWRTLGGVTTTFCPHTPRRKWWQITGKRRKMEAAVFIVSLVDCCALIFLSVYFVSFSCMCVCAAFQPVLFINSRQIHALYGLLSCSGLERQSCSFRLAAVLQVSTSWGVSVRCVSFLT